MGLFDKKYCDVCGEKIGLLGNRKLEDGNLCKNCAKKLSPWFNERRHSTVDEIKAQLQYREENKQRVASFRTGRAFGESWKVFFDDANRCFTVTRASSPNTEDNPDIIDYSAITGCHLNIDEDKDEIYRENAEGNRESYNPPRYNYSYDFDLIINVANPYFDEIKIRLNSLSVEYAPEPAVRISLFGQSLTGNGVNPENCSEYCRYRNMGQEICAELDRARGVNTGYGQQVQNFGQQPQNFGQQTQSFTAPAAAAVGTWVCGSCGTNNSGKFCEGCGSPRPQAAPARCPACGFAPAPGQAMPKFCPECGKQIL